MQKDILSNVKPTFDQSYEVAALQITINKPKMSRKWFITRYFLNILLILLISNTVDNEKGVDYHFQDRRIERLHALTQYVDQLYAQIWGEPHLKLLNGICPEKLLEETKNEPGFICKASDSNNCYCLSHKSANWFFADAFCRRFGMTLAESLEEEQKPNFFLSLNRSSTYIYWTSGSNNFIHNGPVYMNTGKPIPTKESSWSQNMCLSISSTKTSTGKIRTQFLPSSCLFSKDFVCHRFLKFYPI